MFASLGAMPREPERWAFEYKWDGVRAMCYLAGSRLRIESRNGADVTDRYPELASLAEAVADARGAVLDGEIIALDASGRPSFGTLQYRMHTRQPSAALRRRAPVTLMLFDVLMRQGHWLLGDTYEQRREALESLALPPGPWQVPPSYRGQGPEMLQAARGMEFEGLIAKRPGSLYVPGSRSRDWIKIKLVSSEEMVIGGWQEGQGSLTGTVGSLLLGYYDDQGALHYAGKAGSGMTDNDRKAMLARLKALPQSSSPFTKGRPPKAHWVRPELVIAIEHRGWTHGGHLRQPSLKGLRTDKPATEVVRERVLEAPA